MKRKNILIVLGIIFLLPIINYFLLFIYNSGCHIGLFLRNIYEIIGTLAQK